jgi:hypothetical protein
MSRTTIVRHPDGTTSRRKSANAVYSYAVVVGPADPTAYADRLDRDAAASEKRADKLAAVLEHPKPEVTVRLRGVHSRGTDPDVDYNGEHSYHGYEAKLVGTTLTTHCDSQGMTEQYGEYDRRGEYHSHDDGRRIVPVRDALTDTARGFLLAARRSAASNRARAYRIRIGDEQVSDEHNGWMVARWSTRRDLAAKAASGEFAGYREFGRPVMVVEAKEG